MSRGLDIEIIDVPKGERTRLLPILDESFEGLYLWHARRTLQSIELVRVARLRASVGGEETGTTGEEAGLIMLKLLGERAGYVYYVAVPPRYRRRGIGGKLLDDAVTYFSVTRRAQHVYASVEEDNLESKNLFHSRGFEELEGGEMAARYGRVRAFVMYREMMVVPGELLLGKQLE